MRSQTYAESSGWTLHDEAETTRRELALNSRGIVRYQWLESLKSINVQRRELDVYINLSVCGRRDNKQPTSNLAN